MRRYKLEQKEFSEINITPFTDVVLVLLIIFMIASPFLVTGAMKVKLPQASTSENIVKRNVEVFVTENNEISVDDVVIPENQLEAVLKVKYSIKNNNEVVVNADSKVTHGTFIRILDIVKKSGASKLLIGTIKK